MRNRTDYKIVIYIRLHITNRQLHKNISFYLMKDIACN
jgi:hypothetical protein